MRYLPLLLALACSENKLHAIDSVPGAPEDSGDSVAPEDSPVDSEPDPCADAPPEELACDGLDEDCDGQIDEGSGLADCVTWWTDEDQDELGVGDPSCTCEAPEASAASPGDCDDADASRQVCRSCLDILQRGLGGVDGAYSIDPDGAGAFDVYCDMSTDGGGWTMALSLNALGMTHYDGAEVLETQRAVGAYADDNHLSPAFYRLSFTNSYMVDERHGVPVLSETPWEEGTVAELIDGFHSGDAFASSLWSRSPRTAFQLRSTQTTDALFQDGDLRVHFLLNSQATTDIAFPVTLVYQPGERHLVFDSDYGYAGARIYDDPIYDVATTAVDERIRLFLR